MLLILEFEKDIILPITFAKNNDRLNVELDSGMIKANKLLVLFFLVGIVTATPAQAQSIQPFVEKGFETDSLFITSEADSLMKSYNPAEELYNQAWEAVNIRYPQSTFHIKDDTIKIAFVGATDHAYVQPYHGKVISKYGPRNGRMHTGTDIKLNSGDSVLCAFDGKVRLARVFNGYGNMVLVRHNNGLETIYGHLNKINVHVNDIVKAGDLLGFGGRTGRATCDHLHFETRLFGEHFDPNKYIDFENGKLRADTLYYLNKKVSINIDDLKTKTIPPNNLASNSDGENPIHVIEPGDNLWTIAKMYNTTVKNLCMINNITARQILRIGAVLYLP